MAQSAGKSLLGDIGGTKARFALLSGGDLGPVETLPVADFPGIADAIGAFLARYHDGAPLANACLAIASPVTGERCTVINSGWLIDAPQLRAAFTFDSVRLINDFEAIAWALPHLKAGDVFALGEGRSDPAAPAVILGPGTGLGMACLVPGTDSRGSAVIASEGGHATVPASCHQEDVVIDRLRQRFGHVSAERVLSGSGLENLYCAIADIESVIAPGRHASEITKAAIEGSCPASRLAVDMFCSFLGTVAGNLALTFAARGGVYIAGGIVPQITGYLARSAFRQRFSGKGRFQTYLEAISTSVIVYPDPAFIGLRRLATRGPDG